MSAETMSPGAGNGKGSSLEFEVIPLEERAGRAESTRRRFEVLKAFSFTCQYCGQKPPDVELVVEHVVPLARGGGDTPDNWTCACQQCNSGKAISLIPGGVVKTLDGILKEESQQSNRVAIVAERLKSEWEHVTERAPATGFPEHRMWFLRRAATELGAWRVRNIMRVAAWSVPPSPNSADPGDIDDEKTWMFFAMQVVDLAESNFMVD